MMGYFTKRFMYDLGREYGRSRQAKKRIKRQLKEDRRQLRKDLVSCVGETFQELEDLRVAEEMAKGKPYMEAKYGKWGKSNPKLASKVYFVLGLVMLVAIPPVGIGFLLLALLCRSVK